MSEQKVRDSGVKFRMQSEMASGWYTARRGALPRRPTGSKCWSKKQPTASWVALEMRKGLTADDLKTTMFAHPTATSDIGYML